MAWNKELIAEGVLAPDLNDEIRANWDALETALNKEMNFSTGGTESLQGILKQGGARMFAQAAAPATRVDGSAFASTDLGMLWIDTDDNKIYSLTATTPTWTLISTEIIATLLAAARQFAEAVTFDKAAVLTLPPTLTAGIVANNAYLAATNAAGTGTVDLIKADGSDVVTLPDGAVATTQSADDDSTKIATTEYADAQILAQVPLNMRIRGWINLNGTGTIAARGHYNVSSVDDEGTGQYKIHWSTDFANANYCAVVTSNGRFARINAQNKAWVQVYTYDSAGNLADADIVCVMAIGDQ